MGRQPRRDNPRLRGRVYRNSQEVRQLGGSLSGVQPTPRWLDIHRPRHGTRPMRPHRSTRSTPSEPSSSHAMNAIVSWPRARRPAITRTQRIDLLLRLLRLLEGRRLSERVGRTRSSSSCESPLRDERRSLPACRRRRDLLCGDVRRGRCGKRMLCCDRCRGDEHGFRAIHARRPSTTERRAG